MIKTEVVTPADTSDGDFGPRLKTVLSPRTLSVLLIAIGILAAVGLAEHHPAAAPVPVVAAQTGTGSSLQVVPADSSALAPQPAAAGSVQSAGSISPTAANSPGDGTAIQTNAGASDSGLQDMAQRSQAMNQPTASTLQPTGSF